MVSNVQGNCARRTYIRGQRMKSSCRVSENKMGEGDNRALGHVIKEEVSTGTLKGEYDPSWAIFKERRHDKRALPRTHVHSTHCPNSFSGDTELTPSSIALSIARTHPILSSAFTSQCHLSSWPGAWGMLSSPCGMSGCMTVPCLLPLKGSVLGELYLDPVSHSL